jgi:uncharacterized protein
MKFELDSTRTGFIIKAYERDCVVIGETRYAGSLVVTPAALHTDLLPRRFSALTVAHLTAIAATGAEILIIGSGPRQIFLDAAIITQMGARGIGVEVMGNAAACRCYNVLASEQRAVAAALFIN